MINVIVTNSIFYIACSLTRVRKTQEGFMLHLRYRGYSVVCKQTIIGRGFFTIKSLSNDGDGYENVI